MQSATKPIFRPLPDCGALIAGGTSGGGLATALQFVDAGVVRIAIIGRNEERGHMAREAILARAPAAQVAERAIPLHDNLHCNDLSAHAGRSLSTGLHDASSMRVSIAVGSAIPAQAVADARRELPTCEILSHYGCSENMVSTTCPVGVDPAKVLSSDCRPSAGMQIAE